MNWAEQKELVDEKARALEDARRCAVEALNTRRKLASMCDTAQRVYVALENWEPLAPDDGTREVLNDAAKKLRAAIVAAT